MKSRLVAIGMLTMLVVMAASAAAQGVTGNVSGTVKDAQGGVIPGATVTLISEARGTKPNVVVTNASGDFVIPNVSADTYTIQIDMPSFRTLKRTGLAVSPGARIELGTIVIEVGSRAEEVVVKGETPVIQAASGEKSFTITTESVASLPLANRSYDALLGLMPGVQVQGGLTPAARLGGGGDSNFMLDGATSMDPGVNRPATRVSVEAIQEVRVATSAYQAEYGRASGLQVNAVTRGGTNRFLGSLYDVERSSAWNENNKANILNSDPKPFQDERDWGFTVGGPVGKPGHANKLFFFYTQEFQPRAVGGDVTRYRLPTLKERQGDFSESTNNLGQPYPYIKDPSKTGTCNATSQVACFADGGVLGKIPQSALYAPGMAILNWYPLPNLTNVPAGQAYNTEVTYPKTNLLGYQPVIRIDYQPTQNIRGSFKFFEYQQPNDPIQGILAGWNDTREDNYGIWVPAANLNWTINNKTFAEFSWGGNTHHQEGCSVTGAGPNFCRSALQVNAIANKNIAGFGAIPYIFPDATILDPNTFSYEVVSRSGTTVWDGQRVLIAPAFTWNGRVANSPPNNLGPFGNFILDTNADTLNATVTRLLGRHTAKLGYFFYRSVQRRGEGPFYGSIAFTNDEANNPYDTSFPFANAAIGTFQSYSQQSRWAEGSYTAINHEVFIQDNWKATSRLTLDYGFRFVHQVPQYDAYGNASNFFPQDWASSQAPVLYVAGCANGAATCSGTTRQAKNPNTGQFLGSNSQLAIGTLVPGTGNTLNGIKIPGKDIAETHLLYPTLSVAPRFGAAWDVSGTQKFVVRGGAGLFFDRPPASPNVYDTSQNPPFTQRVQLRYGKLQDLSSAGLQTVAPPALSIWQYEMPLPSSTQWNIGVQAAVPFSTVVDVSYTGQHSFNTISGVNINNLDLGWAYLPKYADPTQATPTPANSYVSVQPDLIRFYRGYSTITQQQSIGWRTYHSIQLALTRRLKQGYSFGFNDTIQLSDKQFVAPRLQHNDDGTITVRADQAKAQELLGDNHPQAHVMRAYFTWDMPDIKTGGGVKQAIGLVVNDWSLSGIWNGASGIAYNTTFSYQTGGGNVNLTGSPDYAARVYLVGDPGNGCDSNPLKQFNTAAFKGPAAGSDGLESGAGYLRGCFVSSMDLAIARMIRLPHGRSIQIRLDVFNAFNQAAITNRITSMTLASPADPTTILNNPYNADGSVNDAFAKPRGAGFGVATQYQAARTAQFQFRFAF
jgi:Carboxypeptidase regulatory-like domain